MMAEWNMFIHSFIHSTNLIACLLFAQLGAWGCGEGGRGWLGLDDFKSLLPLG